MRLTVVASWGIAFLFSRGAAAGLPSLTEQPSSVQPPRVEGPPPGPAPRTAVQPPAPKAPPQPAVPAAPPAPAPMAAPDPLERAMNTPLSPGGGTRYVGVALGAMSRNPLPPAKKAPPQVIWSGFQSGEAGSRVFIQISQSVNYDLEPAAAGSAGKPGTVSIFLRNCRIHLRNNSRHLDTRFFPTPVEGVTAVQRRKDVELRIALKQPATPTPRLEPGPDGTQFLVLEFPPGQAVPDDTAVTAEPADADPSDPQR